MFIIKAEKNDVRISFDNGISTTLLHTINLNESIDMQIVENVIENASGGDILVLDGKHYCKGGNNWHRPKEKLSNSDVLNEIKKRS